VASPNRRNGHVIGAQLGRQATAAPLGGSILRVTTGPLQYARFEPCCIRAHFAPPKTGYQPSLVAVHAQDSEKREIVRDIMKDNGLSRGHFVGSRKNSLTVEDHCFPSGASRMHRFDKLAFGYGAMARL
jgi:hypothetical protein